MKDGLELLASKEFECYDDMYKIVDFFNKNLSEFQIIIGLSSKNDKHIINIYKCN